jgi:N-acetylglucosamine-6-phosphate deacetylase
VGAVLQSEEVVAEIIGDGVHVHPALVRATVAAKGASRVIAISDGTAASGLTVGAASRLGGRTIVARDGAAYLADGTLAGSTATMGRVFRTIVCDVGLSLVDAALMCATTPARELGLANVGALCAGTSADLTVLDASLSVVRTYVGGVLAHPREGTES